MTDYIKRAEALEITTRTCGDYAAAFSEIRKLPAADVAEVVRCKDCKYGERYERKDGTAGYYCGHEQNSFTYGERWDRVFKPVKEEQDFCSYGERRGGGDDDVSD